VGVPAVVAIWCWIPLWIANGGPRNVDALHEAHPVALVLWLVMLVMNVWTCVILVSTIAEVQSFSIWRTLDSVVLLYFLGLIGVVLILLILKVLLPSSAVHASPNALVAPRLLMAEYE